MTIADRFFNERAGKYINDDGAYGAQCMDLYADYQRNYLKVPVKGASKAKDVWNSFNSDVFVKIANTPSFVPQRGDVAVWYMGTYGHIAICTGEGNTNYFVSLDQNWDSPWDGSKPSRYVRHDYNSFYGVLRPKINVNFDQEAYDAAERAKAQAEADRLAREEAARVAAEQKRLAEEQARLEAERKAKEEADLAQKTLETAQTPTEEIKTPQTGSTQVSEAFKGVFMEALKGYRTYISGALLTLVAIQGIIPQLTFIPAEVSATLAVVLGGAVVLFRYLADQAK